MRLSVLYLLPYKPVSWSLLVYKNSRDHKKLVGHTECHDTARNLPAMTPLANAPSLPYLDNTMKGTQYHRIRARRKRLAGQSSGLLL